MNASTSLPRKTQLPRVAIVGRPNVGKSTLFNRLVGSRQAITDPTPGVTRDPVEAVWTLNGRDVLLVDTGGYQDEKEGMAALVSQKSLDSLAEAVVVVLLVEVTQLTAEDEDFIDKIRRFSDKLVLAVNKTDNETRESMVWEYHALGFSRIVAISAEHGRNIGALVSEIEELLPEPAEESDDEPVPEQQPNQAIRIAILGKPNTGKSTLLNQLTGTDRAIVSNIPGTTRDIIEGEFEFKNQSFTVLDTAGIRRKKAVNDAVEYYSVSRAISTVKNADVVLLMIDAQEGLTDQDKKIADQIVKHGRGCLLVLNKWDLLDDVANTFNAVHDRTRYLFPILDFAPILAISAQEGTGIDELLKSVVKVRKQLTTRVATPRLNQALKEWIDHHPLPYGKKRYRAKYITQVSSDPVKFALFVNNVRGFPGSWVSYIENNIRSDFDVASIPIQIELRGR